MLSPRRRSSSPVSIVVASPRIAAAAANNTTEVYEVGTPSSLRHQRAPSSSQLQISSPVFLDTPLEEYVVPAGRAAATAAKASTPQKLLLSPHSAAVQADPLPTRDAAGAATPTKDVLRSYSHRSLFRPAREDIDAVRRISSSLHVVKSATTHHHTTSSSATTTAQPQEAQVASSWC
ncbi:Hypothetical protein, putative [Bodo saltans]|uniref:Uncharacterized protein n=1 Tax=Bodo saltans TaxID=75058 RepID=A0A0S4J1H3_BODSA|nr:Hypothetical protein, putative [Bodo saltans]|eukprot:CUG32298.1 Hypothetical protein, putative [Bodo saltans]